MQEHPFVLGHELSGTVTAVGAAVTSIKVGTRVVVHPASTTGSLPTRLTGRMNLHPNLTYLGSAAVSPHRDGAFAEEIVVHHDQVRLVPDGLSLSRAALAEPFSVALHAVARAGQVEGQTVMVSRELDLRGAFRFTDEMDRALAVLRETPAADDLITHTFPPERAGEAFAVAADGGASCKVLLEFDGS